MKQKDEERGDLAGKVDRIDRRVTSLESALSIARELREMSKAINALSEVMPLGGELLGAVYELRDTLRRYL